MGPRVIDRLKSRQVLNARPKPGKPDILLCDGGGLYLQCTRSETDPSHIRRSWVFKFQLVGQRREMGLGPLSSISLAKARAKARSLREQILDGIDPLDERRKARQAIIVERAKTIAFEECAASYIRIHEPGWKNERHRAQWRDTLRQYAFPVLGKLAPKDIDSALIFKMIEPLWASKTTTASRLLTRISAILDFAATSGFRTGDNPARFVRSALPKPSTIAKREHHAALAYADIPLFMTELRGHESIAARALEMLILCASRTGEIAGALEKEIKSETKTWEIPAERMKSGRVHRVPLSDRALAILRALPRRKDDERVFPIGVHQLARLLGAMRPGVTVHGLRSTFRDWVHEHTAFPDKIAEMALAHAVGDETELAYKRSDLLERRRQLMQQWANYCMTPPAGISVASNVVAIGG